MSEIDDWTGEIHQGDSRVLVNKLPVNSIDLVLADPPYNISEMAPGEKIEGLDDMGRRGEDGGEVFTQYGEWDEGETRPSSWVKASSLALKESGSFISFYDALNMGEMREALESVGYDFFSKYYWVKPNPAPQIRSQILMPGAEEMWFAAKGGAKSFYRNNELPQRSSAIVATPPTGKEYTEHPTQKPVKVMKELIRYHCPPDGVVLDPFLGSGTTAVAAELTGRDWVGIEREEEYALMAESRIKYEAHHDAQDAMESDW